MCYLTDCNSLEKDNKVERSRLYYAFLHYLEYYFTIMINKTDQVMTVKHQMQSAVSTSALCADSSTGEHTLGDPKDHNMVDKDNSDSVHHRLEELETEI